MAEHHSSVLRLLFNNSNSHATDLFFPSEMILHIWLLSLNNIFSYLKQWDSASVNVGLILCVPCLIAVQYLVVITFIKPIMCAGGYVDMGVHLIRNKPMCGNVSDVFISCL